MIYFVDISALTNGTCERASVPAHGGVAEHGDHV